MKKRMATRLPSGICEKMNGRVLNTRPGPSCGFSPKAKTAGMMAHPAIRANIRSETAMETEDFAIFSLLFT